MTSLLVRESTIAEHYSVLNTIGCLGPSPAAGFLRAAFSDEETAAMRYIEGRARDLGADARWDHAGNLSLSWPGTSPGFVETGSHLDTVPMGGNYDGAAGAVAGLSAIAAIVTSGEPRTKGLRLRIWRCEESSTYNAACAGSNAAFGLLPAHALENRFRGRTLAEAMAGQGVDVAAVRAGKPSIPVEERDEILGLYELHIEQGNLLEVEHVTTGIITSIRGSRRFRVRISGEFDHSGATPMGVEYRQDANLAMAYMHVRLDERCAAARRRGEDVVSTVGVINSNREWNEADPRVYQNAVPKVSGFAYFCFDVRSSSNATLERYSEEARTVILDTARELRVNAEVEQIGGAGALEATDSRLREILTRAAAQAGISSREMPSGALHDAAIVGSQLQSSGERIPVGMIFIPCRRGKSHCPEELASSSDIAAGATVLANAMLEVAR